jgi:pilus assembly protein CpaB
VLAALVAAVLVYAAVNSGGDEETTASPARVDVVVAAQDIPAGTRLTDGMLRIAPVAPGTLLQGTYTEVSPLVGYVARYPLSAGEQIAPAKIGLEGEDEDALSQIIPPGLRAFSASVTEVSGVGGLLLPGDWVDVIAVYDPAEQGSSNSKHSVTLFQNVEVLAVAQVTEEPLPPAQVNESEAEGETAGEQSLAQRPEDAEPQPEASTVTLALTPDQAQLLALAQEEGTVWLSLRPFGEESQVELDPGSLVPFTTP